MQSCRRLATAPRAADPAGEDGPISVPALRYKLAHNRPSLGTPLVHVGEAEVGEIGVEVDAEEDVHVHRPHDMQVGDGRGRASLLRAVVEVVGERSAVGDELVGVDDGGISYVF